jgi:hypothetical protein
MFHRRNRIALAAGITVTVIAAMAGPASARALAAAAVGAAASTPVPVDITGDITWTENNTENAAAVTVADKYTGTFHVDLTNVTNGGQAAGGDSSTYSYTHNYYSSVLQGSCTSTTTGSSSGSGPLLYPNGGIDVNFNPSMTAITVYIGLPATEEQTVTNSGPPGACDNGTTTNTVNLNAGVGCVPGPGQFLWPNGSLNGTYPNATVNVGCSETYTNAIPPVSGSSSVTGTLTITPSCGSATASSPAPTSSSSATSARSATSASASSSSNSCPVHYTVTVEQWIPQSSVVDPIMPLPVPYTNAVTFPAFYIFDPDCLQPPLPNGIYSSYVRSSYHGDGHADFGGSYREEFEIEFDFDGQAITNFKEDTPQTGITIRNKTYTAHGSVIASCSTTGHATPMAAAGQTSDTTFTMSSAGKNPLTPPALTPSFSTALSGSLDGNGDLQLSGSMTDFPSQGIQVTENGQPVLTDVASDVSCLSEAQVTGVRGALNLSLGLTSSHDVTATAYASGGALSADIPSPLCSSFR